MSVTELTSSPGAPAEDRRTRGSTPRTLRGGGRSVRWRPRVVVVTALAALACLGVATWTMMLGDFAVPAWDVVTTTFGAGTGEFDFIVRTLRLPRTLAAVLVGVALACSGAIFQSLVRNPLVSPDIIGVSTGAGLAAVTFIVLGGVGTLVPLVAFAGAVGTAAVLYVLAWRRGISGQRLVLVGIAVQAVAGALISFVLVRYPIQQVSQAYRWLTGSLYGRTWEHVLWIAVGLAILLPLLAVAMPRLRALQLGDDTATALGTRTGAARTLLLVLGAGLAAVAVAVGGPIPFVALMVPHAARLLLGPLTGGVLVVTALLGALLVLVSDLLAQHAFGSLTLPVGVVTAAVGAPYFLLLLYRSNRGF